MEDGYFLVHLSSNLDCTSYSSCSFWVATMIRQGREILVPTMIQQGEGRRILSSTSGFQPRLYFTFLMFNLSSNYGSTRERREILVATMIQQGEGRRILSSTSGFQPRLYFTFLMYIWIPTMIQQGREILVATMIEQGRESSISTI